MTLRHVIALSILAAPLSQAATIGWNYDGVGDDTLATTDIAGAPGFAQDNWNNHAGSGQGTGSVPLNDLVDDSGSPTTVDVTAWSLSTPNSWQHSQSATPNEKLMNSFNNQSPSLTFDQIPYSAYTVVVYYGDNEIKGGIDNQSLLTVGSLSRIITTGDTANSSYGTQGFLEGTDSNPLAPTNYSVFTGLTGGSLTVSLTPANGLNNHGLSAIQIVQVPEPASLGLLGIGLLASALHRRR